MSRSQTLSEIAVAAINSVITAIPTLDNQDFSVIDRSSEGCFYLPELPLGVPVVFRGQCENVTVVENFNLTRVRFDACKHVRISTLSVKKNICSLYSIF